MHRLDKLSALTALDKAVEKEIAARFHVLCLAESDGIEPFRRALARIRHRADEAEQAINEMWET